LILWIPSNDARQVLWFGRTPSLEWCRANFDVDDVRPVQNLDRYIRTVLGSTTPLFVLHNDQMPPVPENSHKMIIIDKVRLQPAMDAARVIKTDYEVALLRRASYVSSKAHRSILTQFKNLSNEREVEAIFRGWTIAYGAKRQAYGVIAGSGVNASTLHYMANDQPLAGKQLMVLDAGCEWACYASDITRTLPIGGRFTAAGQVIYDIVDKMQSACLEGVTPGALFYDLHIRAHLIAATGLLSIGILQGAEPQELVAQGTTTAFFPHGLGHHVGLEVHDVPGREPLMYLQRTSKELQTMGTELGELRASILGKRQWISDRTMREMRDFYKAAAETPNAQPTSSASSQPRELNRGRRPLEKNMVITVEPGIYFCREYLESYFKPNERHSKYINWDLLEKFYPVGGVRIEDTILVIETGIESLSSAPKGQEALNIINGGSSAATMTG
jgi:Xaa-Pro dipeptidase